MNEAQLIGIGSGALIMVVKLAGPVLLTSLAVGLIISLFQSVTQLQEITLTFVPKLAAISLVFLIAGHWMLTSFTGYVEALYGQIPSLLGS